MSTATVLLPTADFPGHGSGISRRKQERWFFRARGLEIVVGNRE
jgi:hypothetical protein